MEKKNIATITKDDAWECLQKSGILFKDDKPEDYVFKERCFDKEEFREEDSELEGTIILYNKDKKPISVEITEFLNSKEKYLNLEETVILYDQNKKPTPREIDNLTDFIQSNRTYAKLEDRHARYIIFTENEIVTRSTSNISTTPIPNLFTIAEFLKGRGYDIG